MSIGTCPSKLSEETIALHPIRDFNQVEHDARYAWLGDFVSG